MSMISLKKIKIHDKIIHTNKHDNEETRKSLVKFKLRTGRIDKIKCGKNIKSKSLIFYRDIYFALFLLICIFQCFYEGPFNHSCSNQKRTHKKNHRYRILTDYHHISNENTNKTNTLFEPYNDKKEEKKSSGLSRIFVSGTNKTQTKVSNNKRDISLTVKNQNNETNKFRNNNNDKRISSVSNKRNNSINNNNKEEECTKNFTQYLHYFNTNFGEKQNKNVTNAQTNNYTHKSIPHNNNQKVKEQQYNNQTQKKNKIINYPRQDSQTSNYTRYTSRTNNQQYSETETETETEEEEELQGHSAVYTRKIQKSGNRHESLQLYNIKETSKKNKKKSQSNNTNNNTIGNNDFNKHTDEPLNANQNIPYGYTKQYDNSRQSEQFLQFTPYGPYQQIAPYGPYVQNGNHMEHAPYVVTSSGELMLPQYDANAGYVALPVDALTQQQINLYIDSAIQTRELQMRQVYKRELMQYKSELDSEYEYKRSTLKYQYRLINAAMIFLLLGSLLACLL
ncbi:Plasmodium exported protein, unknown function [Plasmodium sp. DRC-Itaito]|nr:Plasmodium exported protein, unknown function [Plasmodium sp. DRC-Itaito]